MRPVIVTISTLVLSIFAVKDRPRVDLLPRVNLQFRNSSSVAESVSISSTERKVLDNVPLSTTTESTKIEAISNIVESWVDDLASIGSKETLPTLLATTQSPTTTGFGTTLRPGVGSSQPTLLTKPGNMLPSDPLPMTLSASTSGGVAVTTIFTMTRSTATSGTFMDVSTSSNVVDGTILKSRSTATSGTFVDVSTSSNVVDGTILKSRSTATGGTFMDISTSSNVVDGAILKSISSGLPKIPSTTSRGSNLTAIRSSLRSTDTSLRPGVEAPTPGTIPITLTTVTAGVVTSDWIGSSIYLQPTSSGAGIAMAGSTPNGIPSSLPQVVLPLAGFPKAPIGYTLIQVGFSYELNYEFVVANSLSSAQIFTYLPQGISYGIEVEVSSIIMHSLLPYDTTKSLGYVTTLALAYIPSGAVSNLRAVIHVPLSRLYSNPSSPVSTIMSHINPAISILVNSILSSTSSINTTSTSAPAITKQTQHQAGKTSTAGIAAGAVVAAAASGGAIFFVLRRYILRSGSSKIVHSAKPDLRERALMSGARQSVDKIRVTQPINIGNTLGFT